MSHARISELVSISEAYHTEVNIKRDFNNAHKIEGYVPNEASRRAVAKIIPGLMPTSTKRVHTITGAYGTGKSHFGLVLASLLRQKPEANSVLVKFGEKDQATAEIIQRLVRASKKFLIVVPEALIDATSFNHTLLVALEEALAREEIVFRPRSRFRLAVEKIEGWKKQGQENRSDDPYQKLKKTLDAYRTTPDILKDLLKNFSNDAYAIFEQVHKEVTYGSDFLPYANTDPRELYQETIGYLRSTGEWEGIWVILDEFGSYLSELAKATNSRESLHIQQFAEYCKGSEEKQCHFMVIAHQTLAEYAAGYPSQKDWEKIGGRFIPEHILTNIGYRHEDVEIIDTIIIRQAKTDHQKSVWQEITSHPDLSLLIDDLQNANLYGDQKRDWLQNTLILGCFPLHPFATNCLPLLAQEVGQRQRTLFTFFNDADEGSLRHFVNNQPILNKSGRLNLYTVDLLVTYFGSAAASKPQYKPIMRAREDALSLVGQSILAQRIINTLAIFEIIGANNLQPTLANLIAALHLSTSEATEVNNLLVELTNERIIRPRKNGFLELRRRKGEFDLQEVIREAKNELRPAFVPLDFLKKMEICRAKLTSVEARSYTDQYFVKREAMRDLIIPRSLSNPKEFLDRIKRWYEPDRGKYEGDALILYILPEDTTEVEQAKEYVAMKECQHPQLVIAIPKQILPLTEILLEIAAAQQVKDDIHNSPDKEEADLEELDRIIEDDKAIVSERLDKFLQVDNLVWYCNGDSTSSLTTGEEEKYVSNLLKSCFSKTPVVKDEIAQILRGKDTQKTYRHYVVAELLEQKGYINVKNAGGADQRIFRACLVNTGVLEKKQDRGTSADFEVRAVLPKGTDFAEIWHLTRNDLIQQEKFIQLGTFVRKLLQPPYGLSHQLIELLLAAFFRNRLDEFAIYRNYQDSLKKRNHKLLTKVNNLDAPTITTIVANPDDYVLMYIEVHPTEREYINQIINLVAPSGDDKGEMGILERGRDSLRSWFSALPPITVNAKSYENEYIGKLVELLKNGANIEDAKKLFRSQLPSILSISFSSPSAPRKEEVEELFKRFEQCYVELVNYAEKEALILISELAKRFEADGNTRDALISALKSWYTFKLSDSQRFHTFGGDAGHLKKAVEAEGPIDQRMLKDLPQAMGLGVYTSWIETTKPELFLMKVEQAKKEIEEWRSIIKGGEAGIYTTSPTGGSTNEKGKETAKVRVKTIFESLGLSDDLKKQVLQELLDELM